MDKSRVVIISIAIFVYTLAVIGLTTLIVVPNPNQQDTVTTVDQGANCVDNGDTNE